MILKKAGDLKALYAGVMEELKDIEAREEIAIKQ